MPTAEHEIAQNEPKSEKTVLFSHNSGVFADAVHNRIDHPGPRFAPLHRTRQVQNQAVEARGEVPIRTSPLHRDSSYSGSACRSNENLKNQPAENVLQQKQNHLKSF